MDVQFPWETQPQRNHRKLLDLGPLLVDRDLVPCYRGVWRVCEVTNEDYGHYLNASGHLAP